MSAASNYLSYSPEVETIAPDEDEHDRDRAEPSDMTEVSA